MLRRFVLICAVSSGLVLLNAPRARAATVSDNAPTTIEKLSPAALQALVSGIAFYPDPVVEQLLDAAQHPLQLHQAAEALNGTLPPDIAALAAGELPASVEYLKQYPDLLKQLDEHLSITARLGAAFRVQPQDVYDAIVEVRAAYAEESAADGDEGGASNEDSTGTAAYPVYGGFVARRLLAAGAIHELSEYRYSHYAATNGAAAAGAVTAGDTTAFGAVAGGTVYGPEGGSASGVGGVTGTVTQTESGVQVETQAAGAYATSNGAYGQGQRSGQTSVTQNPDGSTSVSHDASGSGSGANGSGNYTHSGDATVTGDGGGSYHGETTVNANGQSVSTATNAGGGQASTTVTNNAMSASNTYTAGDGQVTNPPTSNGGSGSSSRAQQPVAQESASRHSTQSGGAWTQINREQIAAANKAMQQSWGQLGAQLGAGSRAQSAGANTRNLQGASNKLPGTTRNSTLGGAQPKLQGSHGKQRQSTQVRSHTRGGGRGGRGRR